jgi:hypothetical protein
LIYFLQAKKVNCKEDLEISNESFKKVETIGYGGFACGIASGISILLAILKLLNYIKENMQAKLRVFQGESTKKNLENTNLSEV